MGYLRKRDKISKANHPDLYTYEAPFQKSWIRPNLINKVLNRQEMVSLPQMLMLICRHLEVMNIKDQDFTTYGSGSHLGHVTIWTKVCSPYVNWISFWTQWFENVDGRVCASGDWYTISLQLSWAKNRPKSMLLLMTFSPITFWTLHLALFSFRCFLAELEPILPIIFVCQTQKNIKMEYVKNI